MKKFRRYLATAIIYVTGSLSVILASLLTLTVSALIGDGDEACELIVDILDDIKHVLL